MFARNFLNNTFLILNIYCDSGGIRIYTSLVTVREHPEAGNITRMIGYPNTLEPD